MAGNIADLLAEAESLGLLLPHGAFEVHCSHCHARLDPQGDCGTCGLIGRSAADLQRRGGSDPERVGALLAKAIGKRQAYSPAGGKADRNTGGSAGGSSA